MEYLDAVGELLSRSGDKLYLDRALSKKQILRAWQALAGRHQGVESGR